MPAITLTITKVAETVVVDDLAQPGSPPVGRGSTVKEAVGDWVYRNQERLGVTFDTSAVQSDIAALLAAELAER